MNLNQGSEYDFENKDAAYMFVVSDLKLRTKMLLRVYSQLVAMQFTALDYEYWYWKKGTDLAIVKIGSC